MKKHCFLFTLILFTFKSMLLMAQPTSNGVFLPSVFFKEFATIYSNTSSLSEGNAGANITWDFSAFPVNKNELYQCIDPFSDPHVSSFPSSSNAYKTPLNAGDTLIVFLYDSSNATEHFESVIGSYENYRNTLLTYSVPKIIANRYVHLYNDSTNDPYTASGTLDSSSITGTIKRHGTFKIKYDAYGDLTTNFGTVAGVNRLKTVDTYTDSIIISGNLTVKHIRIEAYDWYINIDPGTKLAHIEHRTIDGVHSDFGFSKCPFCAVTALPENTFSATIINVYPQPSDGKMHVHLNSFHAGNFTLLLTDLAGKIVNQKSIILSKGESEFEMDNSTFANGEYLLTLNGSDYNKTVHVTIEK